MRRDDQQEISDLQHKVATVTTGDDVVLFDMMGPPREFVDQKAIRKHMDEFAGDKDLKVDFLELKVISDGKLALGPAAIF